MADLRRPCGGGRGGDCGHGGGLLLSGSWLLHPRRGRWYSSIMWCLVWELYFILTPPKQWRMCISLTVLPDRLLKQNWCQKGQIWIISLSATSCANLAKDVTCFRLSILEAIQESVFFAFNFLFDWVFVFVDNKFQMQTLKMKIEFETYNHGGLMSYSFL